MSRVATVYTRRGCGLCAQAEALVARLAEGRAAVAVVDVDAEPALAERYGPRVPVVTVDGVEVAEGVVDPVVLAEALGAHGD